MSQHERAADEPDQVRKYNRRAWDNNVRLKKSWTIPVSGEVLQQARQGQWQIILTPTRPVPRDWYPPLEGADVLCLASGGGQQGPVLAAVGARVTVLDNSPETTRTEPQRRRTRPTRHRVR